MPIFNLNPPQTQQNNINVTEDVLSAGNRSTVSVGATPSVVIPANPNRGNYQIYNNSTNTCFIAHSSTVSASSFEFPIPAGNLWYPDISNGRYLGQVAAVTANGTASLMVTEFTIL